MEKPQINQGGWKTVNVKEFLEKLRIKNIKNVILSGNEAIALGALTAGCRFYAGYPITPSSEIPQKMAEYLPLVNGIFIQPEDEIAAMGITNAASACGIKSMTATSGPGFSLKQEEIGWSINNELPIVIVDAQRIGPSTGQPTKPASADIDCIINGRHGDGGNCVIVLSPTSVKECFTLTIEAFNLSERFRTPVIIALDGHLSHLSQNIDLPEKITVFDRIYKENKAPFGLNGNITSFVPIGYGKGVAYGGLIHDECGNRISFNAETAEKAIEHIIQKQKSIIPVILKEKKQWSDLWEEYETDDCECLIIAYGATAKAAQESVTNLRKQDVKIGCLTLKMLWPLNAEIFQKFHYAQKIIIAELNTGQLVKYLYEYFPKPIIASFNKWKGSPIGTIELENFCKNVVQEQRCKNLAMMTSPSIISWTEEKYSKKEDTEIYVFKNEITEECPIGLKSKYSFCPGCGHQSFSNIFLKAAKDAGLTTKNTVIIAGIGCGGIVGTTFRADVVKTSHGRTLNYARAIKMLRPDLNVIVISGDGDLVNIGGNHLLHTAREKFDIKVFCLNNSNYGMTGGQPSGTTPKTAVTSVNFSQTPINLKEFLYDGLKIDFFARTPIIGMEEIIKKALLHRGFAFAEVLTNCTTHFVKKNPELAKPENTKKLQGVWEREGA